MEPRWTHRNLAIQGYRLNPCQAGRLATGVRFSTGLCLPLVAVAVGLRSAPAVFALAGVAMIAGFGPRHPFDEVWNHVVIRRAPPSCHRRRAGAATRSSSERRACWSWASC